jgi:hypothetical protein
MNASSELQWGFKRSAGINRLTDTVIQDMEQLLDAVNSLSVLSPIGWTDYFWIRSVDGSSVYLSGHGWQVHNLVGAQVLLTTGDNFGATGTVTEQLSDHIVVSGITLAKGDRIRIEQSLPATSFFQVDLDIIDYGDTYL